jgi:SAM-dependent methyltransferase
LRMSANGKTWDDVLGCGYKLETPDSHVTELVPFFKAAGVDRVLDLGCGLGRHFRHLGTHGFRIVGIDISKKAVKSAQLASPRKGCLLRADMACLPFKTNAFDVVISWRVVHLARRGAILQTISEIKRILKPGGFFYCSLRSTANTLYEIGRQTGTEIEPNTFMMGGGSLEGLIYHFFSAEEARQLLSEGMETLQFYETELEHTEYTVGYENLRNMFHVFLGRKL